MRVFTQKSPKIEPKQGIFEQNWGKIKKDHSELLSFYLSKNS